ncbi:MAG: DUF1841 family protein [Nitrosospira sp.]|nr:DUF1841 family protein [Nitrosospira sp.]MDW7642305.1 DUF1841 family protein [Nitrosomonadaceae bacterium]MBI0407502.1 DUF1841 family protein [Nitrosospira sp.]MBI0414261.1 DUF1841 family protein [Nitrosospira sp.]MBI0415733.1 DUF1841 family protein [Nitrosospira sp.]
MFNLSRCQARQFLFDTWRKYCHQENLSGMEGIALEVILLHPEYQSILDDADHYLDKDYLPEIGSTNPFLHMSMHIAVKEQLSIDQPIGIRDQFNRLLNKIGNEHDTVHQNIECLAEMLWQAQRNQSAPDATVYLNCLEKRERKLGMTEK